MPGIESSPPVTEAALRIACLVSEGLTNREIAERLFLSPATVKWYVSRLLKDLELRRRAQLAAWYIDYTRRNG